MSWCSTIDYISPSNQLEIGCTRIEGFHHPHNFVSVSVTLNNMFPGCFALHLFLLLVSRHYQRMFNFHCILVYWKHCMVAVASLFSKKANDSNCKLVKMPNYRGLVCDDARYIEFRGWGSSLIAAYHLLFGVSCPQLLQLSLCYPESLQGFYLRQRRFHGVEEKYTAIYLAGKGLSFFKCPRFQSRFIREMTQQIMESWL